MSFIPPAGSGLNSKSSILVCETPLFVYAVKLRRFGGSQGARRHNSSPTATRRIANLKHPFETKHYSWISETQSDHPGGRIASLRLSAKAAPSTISTGSNARFETVWIDPGRDRSRHCGWAAVSGQLVYRSQTINETLPRRSAFD
jgi:hypothetical protein